MGLYHQGGTFPLQHNSPPPIMKARNMKYWDKRVGQERDKIVQEHTSQRFNTPTVKSSNSASSKEVRAQHHFTQDFAIGGGIKF